MIDTRTAGYGIFLLRAAMGFLFIAHASLKLFVFTPAGTEHFFASLGLPPVLGLVVMIAEFAAGAALVLGVYARIAAIIMLPDLLGAIATVHIHNGFFFNNAGGGWEYPGFWALCLAVLALLGDGAWALKRSFSVTA